MTLGAWTDSKTGKPAKPRWPEENGAWDLDEDDYLLLAMLADPVYCAELLFESPTNHEYGGAYTVYDYEYPLFRLADVDPYAGAACARSVGKTESIKARSVSHGFRRIRMNLLLTAPELIHLLPLTDAVEERINATRLTREFLDTSHGKTGFTHRPFGCKFADGTQLVGRIPRITGTGVKGQHQPDLLVDEAQDYPDAGWTEVHETVMKDTVDADGNPDFTYHFYGVHSGERSGGFHKRMSEGGFKLVQVTALQRPGWNKAEKTAAKAAYGGTQAPDYRRNILGEPGAAASPYFVTARLFACLDQDRESAYNQRGYRYQEIRVEEFDDLMLPIDEVLDLPSGLTDVWGGADLGLTNSPTSIMLFSREKVGGVSRFKLVRRIHLVRMRPKQIRAALFAVLWHFGPALKGFGLDETGLGLPIWQDMEDDEAAPPEFQQVFRGYFFNAKIPVGVAPQDVTEDAGGRLRDRYGNAVEKLTDPMTGRDRFVVLQTVIEAGTRYLRGWVDRTELLLPFDTEITRDMQGETGQRVKRVAGLKQKPNAFHILDAMRVFAVRVHAEEIDEQLAAPQIGPVLEVTM